MSITRCIAYAQKRRSGRHDLGECCHTARSTRAKCGSSPLHSCTCTDITQMCHRPYPFVHRVPQLRLNALRERILLADLCRHTPKTRSNIRMLSELEELQVVYVYVSHSNFVAHHLVLARHTSYASSASNAAASRFPTTRACYHQCLHLTPVLLVCCVSGGVRILPAYKSIFLLQGIPWGRGLIKVFGCVEAVGQAYHKGVLTMADSRSEN